jgi:hypothetical protein
LGCEKEAPVFQAGGDIIGDKGEAVETVGGAVDVYGGREGAEARVHLSPTELGAAGASDREKEKKKD